MKSSVERLAQALPELERELHEVGGLGEPVIGAHDGGVAAGVATAEPALLQDRDAPRPVI
jgi:hypothetical protein